MIDVSANLYNALPQALNTANRVNTSRSLAKPDDSTAAGNSLRSITSNFRQDSAISDFGPKPPQEQGFLSLGPALKALRPSIEQRVSSPENSTPIWEQLLEKQQEISEARRKAIEQQQLREEARRQLQAENDAIEQRVQELKQEVVFTRKSENTPQLTAVESNNDKPAESVTGLANASQAPKEPPPLIGQGDDSADTTPIPKDDAGRLFPPQTAPPKLFSSPPPDNTDKPRAETEDNSASDQQKIQQLFNSDPTGQNAGNFINLFA